MPETQAHATAPNRPLFATAGLLYLAIIVCGVWSEGIARATLITPGAPEATAAAIAAAPGLWNLALAADLAMLLADVAIASVFLRLFVATSPLLAPLAFALRLVQAALIGAALLPLALASRLSPALLDHAIALHGLGYDLGLIFFAVNCAVMAAMLYRAGMAGRLLPLALLGSGAVYLAGSLTALFAPALNAAMQPAYALPLLAETAFCLWFILRGLRPVPAAPQAT